MERRTCLKPAPRPRAAWKELYSQVLVLQSMVSAQLQREWMRTCSFRHNFGQNHELHYLCFHLPRSSRKLAVTAERFSLQVCLYWDRGIDSFEIQIVKISADETDYFYFLAQTLHCMKNTLHFGYKSGFRPVKLLEPSSNNRKLTDRLLFQSRGLNYIRKWVQLRWRSNTFHLISPLVSILQCPNSIQVLLYFFQH